MPERKQLNYASFQRNLNRAPYSPAMPYQGQTARRHRQPKRLPPKFKAFVAIAVVLGIAGHIAWSKHVSAETTAARQAQAVATAEARQKAANFANQINALVAANPNDLISVATASNNSSVQTYGSTGVFDGASTAKLLTAADLLHHVEQGTASLNQNLDGHTTGYWLKIMIVNSDDTAWSELNGFLTHDDLERYANSFGFINYDPATNTFTAGDTALLLQKLYAGQLLRPTSRALLLRYMGQANYRQYIVAAVPSGDSVYHKTGIDDDTINDAAIVTQGQKYLILVIFTDGQGSYDWPVRTQLIHTITQDAAAAYL